MSCSVVSDGTVNFGNCLTTRSTSLYGPAFACYDIPTQELIWIKNLEYIAPEDDEKIYPPPRILNQTSYGVDIEFREGKLFGFGVDTNEWYSLEEIDPETGELISQIETALSDNPNLGQYRRNFVHMVTNPELDTAHIYFTERKLYNLIKIICPSLNFTFEKYVHRIGGGGGYDPNFILDLIFDIGHGPGYYKMANGQMMFPPDIFTILNPQDCLVQAGVTTLTPNTFEGSGQLFYKDGRAKFYGFFAVDWDILDETIWMKDVKKQNYRHEQDLYVIDTEPKETDYVDIIPSPWCGSMLGRVTGDVVSGEIKIAVAGPKFYFEGEQFPYIPWFQGPTVFWPGYEPSSGCSSDENESPFPNGWLVQGVSQGEITYPPSEVQTIWHANIGSTVAEDDAIIANNSETNPLDPTQIHSIDRWDQPFGINSIGGTDLNGGTVEGHCHDLPCSPNSSSWVSGFIFYDNPFASQVGEGDPFLPAKNRPSASDLEGIPKGARYLGKMRGCAADKDYYSFPDGLPLITDYTTDDLVPDSFVGIDPEYTLVEGEEYFDPVWYTAEPLFGYPENFLSAVRRRTDDTLTYTCKTSGVDIMRQPNPYTASDYYAWSSLYYVGHAIHKAPVNRTTKYRTYGLETISYCEFFPYAHPHPKFRAAWANFCGVEEYIKTSHYDPTTISVKDYMDLRSDSRGWFDIVTPGSTEPFPPPSEYDSVSYGFSAHISGSYMALSIVGVKDGKEIPGVSLWNIEDLSYLGTVEIPATEISMDGDKLFLSVNAPNVNRGGP